MIQRDETSFGRRALGVTGRAVVNHLVSLGDWEVIGLSRRRPEFETVAKYLPVDLLNRRELEESLSGIKDITHIFYAALQPAANVFDEVAPNLAMLVNTVEVVEQSSRRLRKVLLVEGAKFYGAHLGAYKTPAKESDPRHMPPNFYYNQEDYLVERSAGKAWSWTAFRPSSICGFAVGNPMNMATVIAVYATLCKEMKLPFRFPGLGWRKRCLRRTGVQYYERRLRSLGEPLAAHRAIFPFEICSASASPADAVHVRQGADLECSR